MFVVFTINRFVTVTLTIYFNHLNAEAENTTARPPAYRRWSLHYRAIARFSLLLQSTSCLKCLKKEHVIISSSRGLHSHPHAWSAHLVGETEFLSDFPAACWQPNSRSDPELSPSLLSSGQCLLHMYCFSVPRALAKCTTHVCVWLSSFLTKILYSRQELFASDRTVT